MAETLGTLTALLTLIDTALTAHNYVKDFHHALEEKQRILDEMKCLKDLLVHLEDHIKHNQSTTSGAGMNHHLASFKSEISPFTEELQSSNGLSKRLKWTLWGKKEADKSLATLERFKTLLNAWLSLENLNKQNILSQSVADAASVQQQHQTALLQSVDSLRLQHQQDHIAVANSMGILAHVQKEQQNDDLRKKIIEWESLVPGKLFLYLWLWTISMLKLRMRMLE
ncbi:hypothetical protein MVEN_01404200 [Mycena venus]|uniref:Fungal N-terminal domain-containing protein n=1 Tax=Mycena venus TaxID=2733690 RepID=A0A8H6XX92_9AGAR|nr:hypothetical protein MVEN_01404200 [Mycena venus]